MNNDKYNNVPFVVFGGSKSGTTWLQKLIDSHPQIKCHFQLPLFPLSEEQKLKLFAPANAVLYNGKSPFKGVFSSKEEEEEYWLKLELFNKLPYYIKDTFRQVAEKKNLSKKSKEENFKKVYKSIISSILFDENYSIIGTKSYTNFELLFNLYPDAKVVVIVRDGRDVSVSKRFHLQKMGAYYHGDEKSQLLHQLNSNLLMRKIIRKLKLTNEESFQLKDNDSLLDSEIFDKIVKDWQAVNDYIYQWKERYPNNFLVVKYEDLKIKGDSILQEVFRFLGAKDDADVVQQIIEQNDFNKLKKNNKDSFFRKGQSGDWMNYFTPKIKNRFKELGGSTLIKLGYVENNKW